MSETKELKYNEPWILQRADPYVYRHTDGMYYFTASLPEYNGIALRRASTLAGLVDAEETMIWKKHDKGIMSVHIWAPELHYLDGKWYIYFAGGDIDDIWAIRPYVLECADADPITGTWVEKGKMQRSDDDPFSFEDFSLDATVFEHRGEHYYVWAEKVGVGWVMPRSVPASFEVKPDRKWYCICSVVRRETGGRTPNASAARKITFDGWPARDTGLTILSICDSG